MHKTFLGLAAFALVFGATGCSNSSATVTGCPDPIPVYDIEQGAESDFEMMEKAAEGVNEFAQGLIGMAEAEAEKCVDDAGLDWRIYERDGEMFALTMDYRFDRVNVKIEKGIIQDAYAG
jgi:hypothetical protein